jgi:hypothetical protein
MRVTNSQKEFINSLRIGMWVSISAGARVIIDDPREPEENIEVLDETIKGKIQGFLFGRVVLEMPHHKVMVTAHPTSLRKIK